LVVCSALGVDMYDCVFPTRTARFGNALTRKGSLNLKLAHIKSSLKDTKDNFFTIAYMIPKFKSLLNCIICMYTHKNQAMVPVVDTFVVGNDF
jgi:hypothetical protein